METLKQLRDKVSSAKEVLVDLYQDKQVGEADATELINQRKITSVQKYRDYIEAHLAKIVQLY